MNNDRDKFDECKDCDDCDCDSSINWPSAAARIVEAICIVVIIFGVIKYC